MSSGTGAASAGPPAVADAQDPLPESSWTWRRIYVFISTLVCSLAIGFILLMIYRISQQELNGRQSVETTLASIEALYKLGAWLVVLTLVDRVLYLIAPSAEQATKMLATVSALKSGVGFASSSRASSSDGQAESVVTAGAPAPPAPVRRDEDEVDLAP